jgi:hypothetical protein
MGDYMFVFFYNNVYYVKDSYIEKTDTRIVF